jgi:hypothetical protein
MTSTALTSNDLAAVSGGETARYDLAQFAGAYAKTIAENWYIFGVFTGTYALYVAAAYALED